MSTDILFPSADAAAKALLSHLGHPRVERMIVPRATIGELSGGMSRQAPAVLELASGEAIAVIAKGRVLDRQGHPATNVRWDDVKAIWEAPAFEKERSIFKDVPARRKAVDALIARRVAARAAGRVTQFVASPSTGFSSQLRAAGWWNRLAKVMTAHGLAYAAGLTGAALLGKGAMTGNWDPGWFWGWALVLAISVPLFAYSAFGTAWLVIGFGGLMKQRLLAGSLAIPIDRVAKQGVGRLLSRAIESEVLEISMLAGGTQTVLALLELAAAMFVLTQGSAPLLLTSLFGAWILLTFASMYRYTFVVDRWVKVRTELTHTLIEKMNGHRTRIAQQPYSQWHVDEDEQLRAYERVSIPFDRWQGGLSAVIPRGWLVLGVAVTGWKFAAANATNSMQELGAAIFGILLGMVALRHLVWGLGQSLGALEAWRATSELFEAAGNQAQEPPDYAVSASGKVLEVRDLSFRYPGTGRTVLEGCDLSIESGDRILIEGSSGSGKSTLGNVIAGLHPASNGLVLAQGIDIATAGATRWRKQVATAPQYHQNHILAAPLLFNLLLGRNWPLMPGDAQEAAAVCEELGLGPLLSRMPAGMMEMVGDTGWQLSQGERSRVYLARAILQQAPLVILDESFAALDPETLEQCLNCVLKRAPSLLVIAHP